MSPILDGVDRMKIVPMDRASGEYVKIQYPPHLPLHCYVSLTPIKFVLWGTGVVKDSVRESPHLRPHPFQCGVTPIAEDLVPRDTAVVEDCVREK